MGRPPQEKNAVDRGPLPFFDLARSRTRVGACDETERVVRQLLEHDAFGPDLQAAVIGNLRRGDAVSVAGGRGRRLRRRRPCGAKHDGRHAMGALVVDEPAGSRLEAAHRLAEIQAVRPGRQLRILDQIFGGARLRRRDRLSAKNRLLAARQSRQLAPDVAAGHLSSHQGPDEAILRGRAALACYGRARQKAPIHSNAKRGRCDRPVAVAKLNYHFKRRRCASRKSEQKACPNLLHRLGRDGLAQYFDAIAAARGTFERDQGSRQTILARSFMAERVVGLKDFGDGAADRPRSGGAIVPVVKRRIGHEFAQAPRQAFGLLPWRFVAIGDDRDMDISFGCALEYDFVASERQIQIGDQGRRPRFRPEINGQFQAERERFRKQHARGDRQGVVPASHNRDSERVAQAYAGADFEAARYGDMRFVAQQISDGEPWKRQTETFQAVSVV